MTRTSLLLIAALVSGSALAGEYPFTKEHRVKDNLSYGPLIQLHDLDKDRKPDMVGISLYKLMWFKNGKKGKAVKQLPIGDEFKEPYAMTVCDANGDKRPDVVGMARYDGVKVFFNLKKGKRWKTQVVMKKRPHDARNVRCGDIDGDGDNDLVTAGNGIQWLENVGKGKKWEDDSQIYDKARGVTAIELADMDGDDDLDVVAVAEIYGGEKSLVVVYNDDGPWRLEVLRRAAPTVIDVRDWDGDGDLDILTAWSKKFEVYLNHENSGRFAQEPLGYEIDYQPESIALMDVDRDGDVDIVGGSYDGNKGLWWHENPDESDAEWAAHQIEQHTVKPASLVPIDLDGDGDEDLLAVFQGLGENRHKIVWLENKARKKKKKKSRKKKSRKKRR